MTEGELVITVAGNTYHPQPDNAFTFGRAGKCTVCLDRDDVAISRRAGSVTWDNETWWLTNESSSRQFAVVDELGFRSVLPPGRRRAVEGRLRVIVDGTAGSHELVLDGPPAATGLLSTTGDPVPTAIGSDVVLNDADKAALAALFAGYFEEGTKYDPYPKSYAAAAARLGWNRTTLVKRIEYIRERLGRSGVPNMHGWNALSHLAEYVLSAGIITRDDLRRVGL